MIKSLNKRIGALKKISPDASFKTRINLANGIFMSKLIYLMPVTEVLMKQCGWMPVHQLMIFHSLMLLHKTLKQQKPTFLYQKVNSGSGQPNTRQAAATTAALAAAGLPRQPSVVDGSLSLARKSWCWDSVRWYNQLPVDILSEKKMMKFKTRLKDWVEKNV